MWRGGLVEQTPRGGAAQADAHRFLPSPKMNKASLVREKKQNWATNEARKGVGAAPPARNRAIAGSATKTLMRNNARVGRTEKEKCGADTGAALTPVESGAKRRASMPRKGGDSKDVIKTRDQYQLLGPIDNYGATIFKNMLALRVHGAIDVGIDKRHQCVDGIRPVAVRCSQCVRVGRQRGRQRCVVDHRR